MIDLYQSIEHLGPKEYHTHLREWQNTKIEELTRFINVQGFSKRSKDQLQAAMDIAILDLIAAGPALVAVKRQDVLWNQAQQGLADKKALQDDTAGTTRQSEATTNHRGFAHTYEQLRCRVRYSSIMPMRQWHRRQTELWNQIIILSLNVYLFHLQSPPGRKQ